MAEQEEVVEFLSDGASYGRSEAKVKRIDTHISCVFMVEDRVYKLKRSLRFSYLDYSTIALREACCRKELALNRRTAPTLYLGVRSITRSDDGGLSFDGPGTVVDWVLEMQRFPEGSLFDEMAEAGKLSPAMMRDLSDAIASFHQNAELAADQGGATAVAAIIEGNDANLKLFSPPRDRPAIDKLRAASLKKLSELAPLLDARRQNGKVRRCHGDLHLRNVCLFEGRPTLFDCIEFNDALACIDVLYDLAFLLMDLADRGLDDLGNVVFNRYIDMTGDIGGLATLPLFMSMRAAVRAHVLAAQSQQHGDVRLDDEARRYLMLAVALLQPHTPRLIAVGGLSGTGKSTLAQALAGSFRPSPGGRVIRSDVLRKRLAQVSPETKLPPAAYSADMSDRVYRDMGSQTAAVLAAGYTAIADATFTQPRERDAIAAIARQAQAPFLGVWLEAPAALLEQRIADRRHDASDADQSVLVWQMTIDTGPIDWYRIDASRDVARNREEITRLLAGSSP